MNVPKDIRSLAKDAGTESSAVLSTTWYTTTFINATSNSLGRSDFWNLVFGFTTNG